MENKINKIVKDGVEYPIEDPSAARASDLAAKQDALNAAQIAAVNSGIDSTKVGQIATNSVEIDGINEKIPAQASASNQLADKGFVNSSIQTQTAHFRGNWENWNAVPTDATEYPVDDDGNHEPTSNDYMVVQDASGFPVGSGEPALEGTWRFKYSGTWATNGKNGWLPEYQVNETPLTAAQLAALNSGATAALMAKLEDIPADAEANTIDSISVNGTAVTPDENKNVDLTIDEGIKTLTTADYNYPASNPTSVAVWLLPTGTYLYKGDININTNSAGTIIPNTVISVRNTGVNRSKNVFMFIVSDLYNMDFVSVAYTNTGSISRTEFFSDIIDDLTTSTGATRLFPLSANQGKVLKDLIDSIAIRGAGAPTTSTVGTVGQLYEDGTNGDLYQLKSIDITVTPNTYNWEEVGGSSVNVVQTTGTSTADVMSQNAVTKMIYPRYSAYKVDTLHIGAPTDNLNRIYRGSLSYGMGSEAVSNSVAIGQYSSATQTGEMNIGSTNTSYGYNNSNYRLLTGVYPGQSAHDAATVGQLTPAFTNAEFNSIFNTNLTEA